MSETLHLMSGKELGTCEYLGTVLHEGREYIALRPVDAAPGQVRFYALEDSGYGRLTDEAQVRALYWRLRREEASREGWEIPEAFAG